MIPVPHSETNVSPFKDAALLLLGAQKSRTLSLSHAKVEDILQATSVGHSRAYELADELQKLLSSWDLRPFGRPPTKENPKPENSACTLAVLQFVKSHPGCVHGCLERQHYTDVFRIFILDLYERYSHLSLPEFAFAIDVPLGTLKDWLRGGTEAIAALSPSTTKDIVPQTNAKIKTVLEEWSHWSGDFSSFCIHIKYHLRLPFGRTLIGTILEKHGLRSPKRREGRSPDEKALKGAFQTFFPGAQWVGDGKRITVEVGDRSFNFNLELMTDCKTSAAVGFSLRDEEDSQAVIEAYHDGIQTTGAPPLALLLDNKPSNDTDDVNLTLADGETLHIQATESRPQNKAHVEGTFGLFSQTVPPMVLPNTNDPKALAFHVAMLVILTWGRTLNHRPQKKHQGSTRVERYLAYSPSDEEIAAARKSLEERCRIQLLARETLKARQDPVAKEILDQAFARLNLLDPNGNIRAAIARYPLSAICDGIATFEGKRDAETLPALVDGRYLRGIVKNISQKREGYLIIESLIRERLAARDLMLSPLQSSLELLQLSLTQPRDLIKTCLDNALLAERKLDRIFWLSTVALKINVLPQSDHPELCLFCSRRIHATFAISYEDRLDIVNYLFDKVMPLD